MLLSCALKHRQVFPNPSLKSSQLLGTFFFPGTISPPKILFSFPTPPFYLPKSSFFPALPFPLSSSLPPCCFPSHPLPPRPDFSIFSILLDEFAVDCCFLPILEQIFPSSSFSPSSFIMHSHRHCCCQITLRVITVAPRILRSLSTSLDVALGSSSTSLAKGLKASVTSEDILIIKLKREDGMDNNS